MRLGALLEIDREFRAVMLMCTKVCVYNPTDRDITDYNIIFLSTATRGTRFGINYPLREILDPNVQQLQGSLLLGHFFHYSPPQFHRE